MSHNTKILLGILAGTAIALFLCAGLLFFSASSFAWNQVTQSGSFDAAQVDQQAAAIAQFQPPAGYAPDYEFNAAGFRMVSYTPGDEHSHLMLIQAPSWLKLNQSEFEKQLRRSFGDKLEGLASEESALVDHRRLRVAGQPVEFTISEGINSIGDKYRSMAGVWDGASGQVLIYIEEPLSRWNQAKIDAFIATIAQPAVE